jgi:hypothetical protein
MNEHVPSSAPDHGAASTAASSHPRRAGAPRGGYEFTAEERDKLARTARAMRVSAVVSIAYCALGALWMLLQPSGARGRATHLVLGFALQIVASAVVARPARAFAGAAEAQGDGIPPVLTAVHALRASYAITRWTMVAGLVGGLAVYAVQLAMA